MLRQYAFIFPLFLFTFSVLLGGVSAQNDIQSEIEDARKKGYSDEEIRQALKNATWTEEQIGKLLSTPQSETEQEHGKEYDPDDVQQWNLPEGAIRRLGKGKAHDVTYAPDGQWLAIAGALGIWIYDARTLHPVKLIPGDTGWVKSVRFSPDGRQIVGGGGGRGGGMKETLRLWDVKTGKLLKTFKGHTIWVNSVSLSPDGKTIVSGGEVKNVRLWDAETGSLLKTLTGHKYSIRSVRFSPDGKTIATGSDDGTVRLWNADTGRSIKTLKGHKMWVSSVSFSPDGKTLASASLDTTVRLWDVKTGKILKTLTAHTSSVSSVSFSPDGKTLATGSGDGTVRLWDVDRGSILKTLTGHIGGVRRVCFSPDGKTVVSGGWNDTVRLWDVETGRNIKTLIGHTSYVSSVSFSLDGNENANVPFSPDGKTIASGSSDGTVHLWDAETGKHIKTLEGHTNFVNIVRFSPDGKTIASGSSDSTVRLWDVETGKHIKTLEEHRRAGHRRVGHRRVRSISFSPGGQIIASGSSDNTIRLWDVETGRNIKTLIGHTGGVDSVSFSPDSSTLTSGDSDGTILLWDVSGFGTGRLKHSEPQTPRPRRAVGQQQTAEQIAETALASTVLIVMEDADGEPISTGSGFVVGHGIVVTNLHVVEGVFKGYVKPVGEYRQHRITGIVAMDTDQDLALLSVSGVAASPLRLARGGKVSVGERVYVAGNPMGFLEGTFSDGLVSGIRDLGAGREWLQISAPISEGSSGGPVLNKHGEVIGIAVATLNVGQNLNFAIPVKYLRDLLDKVGR